MLGLIKWYNASILTLVINEPNWRDTDLAVNAIRFSANVISPPELLCFEI
jgi:hypothetical protein